MKFKIFRRLTIFGRRWFFHLKSANGEIIMQSEGYFNRADAESIVGKIRQNAAYAKVDVEGRPDEIRGGGDSLTGDEADRDGAAIG